MNVKAWGSFLEIVATQSFGRGFGGVMFPLSFHTRWPMFDFDDVGDGLGWEGVGSQSAFLLSGFRSLDGRRRSVDGIRDRQRRGSGGATRFWRCWFRRRRRWVVHMWLLYEGLGRGLLGWSAGFWAHYFFGLHLRHRDWGWVFVP
ncbi:hypothetical protein RchiOBHm_Chr6g0296041 [Rosa chinensis]|uniref:Uncharacterized protein n=1 Tax=Rosa chinensis TaxID=74649 RepID=A0A2P6PXB1_ROSCH|nr:hypothetical protein RchiOBHm_Chr6g0296041 [Rosa chinensis]